MTGQGTDGRGCVSTKVTSLALVRHLAVINGDEFNQAVVSGGLRLLSRRYAR